jgi:hypothetical protein
MLAEFAKQIDAEMQMAMKKHRNEQHLRGDAIKSAKAQHGAQSSISSCSSRAPATAWSERKRWLVITNQTARSFSHQTHVTRRNRKAANPWSKGGHRPRYHAMQQMQLRRRQKRARLSID